MGVVYTPPEVVDFMLSLVAPPTNPACSVLEPACADAPFLHRFVELYGPDHQLTGVEFDEEARGKFQIPGARFVQEDYLLWNPDERFHLIIGNPPYGIIGDASHYPIHGLLHAKEHYKGKFRTWRGKYNAYGAFIEHSVDLLQPNGDLIFIVPSSWMLLDDFVSLRQFLAGRGEIDVHYVGRVFRGVTVVAVVLHFRRTRPGILRLYEWDRLLLQKEPYLGDMICFENEWTQGFEECHPRRIGELFEIRFAARSPEVKRSPYVHREPGPGRVALLTGRNLKSGFIDYETNYTGLWVEHENAEALRSFYTFPHIVVGHTKGARVVAAYDDRCYPWREEFHLVPKVKVDQGKVVDYLNSGEVQRYVSTLYRDLIPHLTRTQLQRLPIPDKLVPATRPKMGG